MNTVINKYTRLAALTVLAVAIGATFQAPVSAKAKAEILNPETAAIIATMTQAGLVEGSVHGTDRGQLTLTDPKAIKIAKKKKQTLRDTTKVMVTDKFLALSQEEQFKFVDQLADAGNGAVEVTSKDCAAPVIRRAVFEYTGDEAHPTIILNKFEADKAYADLVGVKEGTLTVTNPCIPQI